MTPAPQQKNSVAPVNKKLLRLVYGLGLLMLILFGVLVGGLIYKFAAKRNLAQTQKPTYFTLAPDAQILSGQLQGDKLTIVTNQSVAVVEISTGRVLFHTQNTPKP